MLKNTEQGEQSEYLQFGLWWTLLYVVSADTYEFTKPYAHRQLYW